MKAMENSSLISIILPVYNVASYIGECISSVYRQNYTQWELILIDDGSTDGSSKLCDLYAQDNKKVRVYHKINGGVSSARNYGIEKASGKYVIFMDPDDYWIHDNCLRQFVSIAEEYQADIVRGEYKEVDERGEEILIKDISYKENKRNRILSSAEFYASVVNGENFPWLFFYNKKVFDSNIRFDEQRSFEEDAELNIRLFCKEWRCVYFPEIFYAYRKRANSAVATFNIANLKDSFLLSDVFEEYSHIASDKLLKDVYRHNAVMMYYWTLVTIAEDPYYDQRKEIISRLGLVQLRKKILHWAHKYKVFKKSYIFNVLHPNLAILLFRFRNNYFV